jgi:hypothetical protein
MYVETGRASSTSFTVIVQVKQDSIGTRNDSRAEPMAHQTQDKMTKQGTHTRNVVANQADCEIRSEFRNKMSARSRDQVLPIGNRDFLSFLDVSVRLKLLPAVLEEQSRRAVPLRLLRR